MKKKIILLFIICLFTFPNICFSEVKTFIKEYSYQASEDDSKNSSRVTAMREVKRLLLEELGTYLESVTEVKNFQLTKDQITSLTAGIVKTEIISEKWDGQIYWIKTKIVADGGEVIKSIDNLRKDREKSQELEDMRKRSNAILEENKKLRDELKLSKGAEKERQTEKYNNSIKELSAMEWFENGMRRDGNNYDGKIHDYSKAIELNPNFAVAYFNRGLSYAKLGGKSNEAFNDYNKAIELNPNFAAAYNNRGRIYSFQGKYDKAISDYSKAIELNPNFAVAYFNRGLSYAKLGGKSNEAINDYSKSIELDPKQSDAYSARGTRYVAMKKYEEAMIDLNRALELNPKDTLALDARNLLNEILKLKK